LEKKQLQTFTLSTLTDSRLGIDAAHYISLLLDNPNTREPLIAATGGTPLVLATRIESDLRVLDRFRIKPVFVFPGLNPTTKRQKNNHSSEHMEACRDRREAWSKYENGQEEQATKLFDGSSRIEHWDVWRVVLRIFRHRNVEYLVAPYTPWAQVSWPNSNQQSVHQKRSSYISLNTPNPISTLFTAPPTLFSIQVE
jgi:hypothetical protein